MKLSVFSVLSFLLFCALTDIAGSAWQNRFDDAYTTIRMQPQFDIQGHRGCRGLMPENTVAAMLHALGYTNLTTLEMDVVITKDKKVVLSHEPWMGHEITTRPDGKFVSKAEEKNLNIYKMTYEEVKKYDVGMKPHPRFPKQQKMPAVKPLLSDLIDSVKQYMMMSRRPWPYFNIETKCLPVGDGIYHPKPEEFVELLMAVIKEKQMEDHVIIQSFDFRTLQYLHKKYPQVKTAMLIAENDWKGFDKQLKKLGFVADIYSPHYTQVTQALVGKCHTKKMKLIPWTVNKTEEIEKLKKLGVDGIISDYPDLFNTQ